MHRWYFYLAALISTMPLSVSALAETAATPATTYTLGGNWVHTANDEGLYIALPAVNYSQLLGLIHTYQAALTDRQEEISKYLDENQLDGKDALITVIMPGGLLYAAVRKGQLEQARAELAEITEDMDELSRDLLAMQAVTGNLTVAQLQ